MHRDRAESAGDAHARSNHHLGYRAPNPTEVVQADHLPGGNAMADRHRVASRDRQQDDVGRRHLGQLIADQEELGFHRFDPPSSDARSCLTWLIEMAKPTPTFPFTGLSIELLMPITCPAELTSGPPELPGLIAASVWISPERFAPFEADPPWFRFETIPSVSEPDKPKGEPIAYTVSPIWTPSEFPRVTGCRLEAGTEIRMTARSADEFDPTSVAATVWPLLSVTCICVAPAMTCALVRMSPLVSRTIPEPMACPRPVADVIVTTPGDTCA